MAITVEHDSYIGDGGVPENPRHVQFENASLQHKFIIIQRRDNADRAVAWIATGVTSYRGGFTFGASSNWFPVGTVFLAIPAAGEFVVYAHALVNAAGVTYDYFAAG